MNTLIIWVRLVWVRAGSFVALSRAGHYQKTKGGLARVR
jgi:hypothetical protein